MARARRIETIARARIEQRSNASRSRRARSTSFSPLATLERGYAIVTDSKGTVITNAQDVRAGQLIDARLTQGTIRARIERATSPGARPAPARGRREMT